MSTVTNLILATDYESVTTEQVNEYFKTTSRPSGFVKAAGFHSDTDPPFDETDQGLWYGGSKFMEANLWAGAFNHLDLDALKAHLRSLPWTEPKHVQLFIKEQEDDIWRLECLY